MDRITVAEARKSFADLINETQYRKERHILTKRKKDVAAVIPIEDLILLTELEDLIDIEEIKKAWAEQGKRPLKSWVKIKKTLGLK